MKYKIVVPLKSGGLVWSRGDTAIRRWEIFDLQFTGDILEPLCYLRRFCGQYSYTVGQHLLLGSMFICSLRQSESGTGLLKHWLIHEAAEALGLGDMHHQWKRELAPDVQIHERALCETVGSYLGIPSPTPADTAFVEGLDKWLGWIEAKHLISRSGQWDTIKQHVDPPDPWKHSDRLEVFFTEVWHSVTQLTPGTVHSRLESFL